MIEELSFCESASAASWDVVAITSVEHWLGLSAEYSERCKELVELVRISMPFTERGFTRTA